MQSTLVVNWPIRSFGLRGFPPGFANHEQISFWKITDFYFANHWQISFSQITDFILQIIDRFLMMSQITDFYFANHWQISVSQILQIYISQIIHKHRFSVTLSFAPKRSSDRTIAQIADFHFVSFRFASRITVNQNLK